MRRRNFCDAQKEGGREKRINITPIHQEIKKIILPSRHKSSVEIKNMIGHGSILVRATEIEKRTYRTSSPCNQVITRCSIVRNVYLLQQRRPEKCSFVKYHKIMFYQERMSQLTQDAKGKILPFWHLRTTPRDVPLTLLSSFDS